MTIEINEDQNEGCPAQALLKLISGKWKSEILRLAIVGPVRFNALLKQIHGSNKQSLSVALKEMEIAGLLSKITINNKPLHIEYHLSEKGHAIIPIFTQLEHLSK